MTYIDTKKAPEAIGPYSQAVAHNGLLLTSGQIPLDPATGVVVGATIQEQTEQVMRNLLAVLEAAGSGSDKLLKTTCFLADMSHFAEFNEVYSKYITANPSRSCVAVQALPKGVLVEVEAVACL